MAYDKPIIHKTNPFAETNSKISTTRTIYYGEVTSIDDPTDGGRIKVRILDLDNRVLNEDLSWCYPMIPKYNHIYPLVGEVVRIFIEDIKYPQKSRFWMGSVISQLPKIGFDTIFTALSTTNVALTQPQAAISTYPDAKGVFPDKEDIALIGRINTDVILKPNQVLLRAGKHENDNVYKLNTKNPATVSLVFEQKSGTTTYQSNGIVMADRIALISHTGKPQFKSHDLTPEDRELIFKEGHPMARADILVEALKILRNAIITHIHGYSTLPADKNAIIKDLENLNFDAILQKNIVIN